MLKPAVYLLNGLWECRFAARNCYWFEGIRNVLVYAELAFVIHTPCVDVAPSTHCDWKVLTHPNVLNDCTLSAWVAIARLPTIGLAAWRAWVSFDTVLERNLGRLLEKTFFKKFLSILFARNFPWKTPHIDMTLLCHTSTVTETTSYGLDRYVVQASIWVIAKLNTVGTVEELDLSESAAWLLGLVTQSEGASIPTREDPVSVCA